MIYLSPDAEEVMTKVDPSKMYIIGGIIDRSVVKVCSYNQRMIYNINILRCMYICILIILVVILVLLSINILTTYILYTPFSKNRSLQKAMLTNITAMRLPLQEYLPDADKYVLNIDTVVTILSEYIIYNGDWSRVLHHAVPIRKRKKVSECVLYCYYYY